VKSKGRAPLRSAIFSSDGDGDDDEIASSKDNVGKSKDKGAGASIALVNRSIASASSISAVNSNACKESVDESVFDYDGAVERRDKREAEAEEQAQVHAASSSSAATDAPRYIQNLMKTAQVRGKEREIVNEKRLLKERQAEDALYGDLPSFVTAAYKAKLIAEEKFVQDAAQRDAMAADVHSAGMAGFYGNIQHIKTGHRANADTRAGAGEDEGTAVKSTAAEAGAPSRRVSRFVDADADAVDRTEPRGSGASQGQGQGQGWQASAAAASAASGSGGQEIMHAEASARAHAPVDEEREMERERERERVREEEQQQQAEVDRAREARLLEVEAARARYFLRQGKARSA
jgi:coiled-coil domain-containing protein 55